MNHSKKSRNETNKIELADWFVENKIIEHLFGPNLHVEVIKRSQDIMNFLAFSNRLTDKHLDVIWTSAQVSFKFPFLIQLKKISNQMFTLLAKTLRKTCNGHADEFT